MIPLHYISWAFFNCRIYSNMIRKNGIFKFKYLSASVPHGTTLRQIGPHHHRFCEVILLLFSDRPIRYLGITLLGPLAVSPSPTNYNINILSPHPLKNRLIGWWSDARKSYFFAQACQAVKSWWNGLIFGISRPIKRIGILPMALHRSFIANVSL